jgi:hypothetical protein
MHGAPGNRHAQRTRTLSSDRAVRPGGPAGGRPRQPDARGDRQQVNTGQHFWLDESRRRDMTSDQKSFEFGRQHLGV